MLHVAHWNVVFQWTHHWLIAPKISSAYRSSTNLHVFCYCAACGCFLMADHQALIISLQQFPFLPHLFLLTKCSLSLLLDWCLRRRANSQTSREGGREGKGCSSSVAHLLFLHVGSVAEQKTSTDIQSTTLARMHARMNAHTDTHTKYVHVTISSWLPFIWTGPTFVHDLF